MFSKVYCNYLETMFGENCRGESSVSSLLANGIGEKLIAI